jgi:hypothetical protein
VDPPNLASTTVAACSMFHGKLTGAFRFSHRGEYIGGRAALGGGPGPYTRPNAAKGWPAPWGGAAALWHPLRLFFGLHDASLKIGTLAFVSSNSGHIYCVAFLKHKNSRNRKLALWHLVSRLVLEKA